MIKVVIRIEEPEKIEPKNLYGDELVAYKSAGDIGYCILTKLQNGKHGFVNLRYSSSAPTFITDSWVQSVTLAASQREVRAFRGNNSQEAMDEMIKAIHHKEW